MTEATSPLTRARQNLSQANEALRAWASLGGSQAHAVEPIVLKRRAVAFRLVGAAPGGADVIAKLCEGPTARVEQLVYDRILPTLGLEALTCHGYIEAGMGPS